MNDIYAIYEAIKSKFPLQLTNTSALANEGFSVAVPVICGESRLGRFRLYREDEKQDALLVFSYEFSEACGGDCCHGHPYDANQAIEYIEQFMNCNTKFFK